MKGISIFIAYFLSFSVMGQDYNQMPGHIKQRMNSNKQAGLTIYDGITSDYDVDLSNIDNSEFLTLTNKLEEDLRVKEFVLSPDGKKLHLKAAGNYSIKDIKSHIVTSTTSGVIDNYTVIYTTEK